MSERESIVDDLALFALQGGAMTSSRMAKMFDITNIEARKMLQSQIDSGYVVCETISGERLFRLVELDELIKSEWVTEMQNDESPVQ